MRLQFPPEKTFDSKYSSGKFIISTYGSATFSPSGISSQPLPLFCPLLSLTSNPIACFDLPVQPPPAFNMVPVGGNAFWVLGVLWSLGALTLVFVLLRLYTRLKVVRAYGLDDHFFNASFVSSVGVDFLQC